MTEPMQETRELAEILLQADLTIAIAESLTAGMLTAELARVPGISDTLEGGVVAYQNSIKQHVLGVPASVLERDGAVSYATALAMAKGVRQALKVGRNAPDIGVATTGVAGPASQEGKPAGYVFIGIDSIFGEHVVHVNFANLVDIADPIGSRERVRTATVEAAIFNVTEHLARR